LLKEISFLKGVISPTLVYLMFNNSFSNELNRVSAGEISTFWEFLTGLRQISSYIYNPEFSGLKVCFISFKFKYSLINRNCKRKLNTGFKWKIIICWKNFKCSWHLHYPLSAFPQFLFDLRRLGKLDWVLTDSIPKWTDSGGLWRALGKESELGSLSLLFTVPEGIGSL